MRQVACLAFFLIGSVVQAGSDEPLPIRNVVFDLGDVLLKTDKGKALEKIGGYKKSIGFVVKTRSTPSQAKLFSALAGTPANSTLVTYNKYLKMPQIMVDWQLGLRPNADLLQEIQKHLLSTRGLSDTKKHMYLNISRMMLNPNDLVDVQILNPRLIGIVERLKKSRSHKVYVLSNWDKESFPLLQNKFKDLFEGLDGVIASGNVGKVKPHFDMYQHAVTSFDINPRRTVLVDDTDVNVQMAKRLDWQGFLYEDNPVELESFIFSNSRRAD